jgi:flagellar export protein FliJ
MAKYKFKFQSILNVKEMLEKKIQEEISRINKEIEDMRFELKHLANEKKRVSIQMTEKSTRVSDFQSMKMYSSHLQQQIETVERKMELSLKKREEKQRELVERKKEITN